MCLISVSNGGDGGGGGGGGSLRVDNCENYEEYSVAVKP